VRKKVPVRPTKAVEPVPRALGLMAHPLELAACPSNDIGIDPLEGRTQLRLVKVAVVADPAADAWVVHRGQLSQGQVTAVVKRPASNRLADTRIIGCGLRPSRRGPGHDYRGQDEDLPVPAQKMCVHAGGLMTTRGG